MQTKWVVYIVMVWMMVALICGIAEGVMLGGGNEAGTLTKLIHGSAIDRIAAVLAIGQFNFAIFSGSWAFLRWLFFIPFTVAISIAGLQSLRGVSS